MAAKGAKYKWQNGKILHAARLYKSPTMRRIPRILIEDRMQEVGVLLHIEEPWMIYEETDFPADTLQTHIPPLTFYKNRFHLLPADMGGVDLYLWLQQPGNKLLVWGKDSRYFAKAYLQ